MPDSLIGKIRNKQHFYHGGTIKGACILIDNAIDIIRQHIAAPEVVERVAAASYKATSEFYNKPFDDALDVHKHIAKAAIAAMGDASTRKDEAVGVTTATTSETRDTFPARDKFTSAIGGGDTWIDDGQGKIVHIPPESSSEISVVKNVAEALEKVIDDSAPGEPWNYEKLAKAAIVAHKFDTSEYITLDDGVRRTTELVSLEDCKVWLEEFGPCHDGKILAKEFLDYFGVKYVD